MKLRTKLKVSFCIMIVLPITLCIVDIAAILNFQATHINRIYDVDGIGAFDMYSTPTVLMLKITESIYDDMKVVSETEPLRFENEEYLSQLDDELEKRLSVLIVRKNGSITHSSNNEISKELKKHLPEYDRVANNSDIGTYRGGEDPILIKQLDFEDDSGNKYSVSIITFLDQIIPQMKQMAFYAIVTVVLVLLITSLWLNLWVYGGIIKKVDRLKLATQNIKQGNFDFEMPRVSGDEIGDVCRDFEEMRVILKQTSEDKLKSDMEEKELIRNISHDLKTPLTAIKGYVEGLLDGVANTPEKQEKYLKTIAAKVDDMDNLINQLTIFSKFDTNRVPYSFRLLNARQYFDDCAEQVKTDLEVHNIELEYNYHALDDVGIVADAEQLKRVIYNIVSNSIKYASPDRKGHIDMDVFDEGEYMHIIIKDNGKGIGINELPHIFERFYRTDSSRNSKQGGSGIGLAIVKKIISDHKGKIWAESVEGEGTTMHINLVRSKDKVARYCIEDKAMK